MSEAAALNETDPRFYCLREAVENDLAEAERLVRTDPSIVAARNSIGETALHYLVFEDDVQAAVWLLEHGSDLETRNDFGATPLLEAARLGYGAMCRLLVARGANPRARDQVGDTPVVHAAEGGVDTLQLLLGCLDLAEDLNALCDEATAHLVLTQGGPAADHSSRKGIGGPVGCRKPSRAGGSLRNPVRQPRVTPDSLPSSAPGRGSRRRGRPR
jgi:hypothetical protein